MYHTLALELTQYLNKTRDAIAIAVGNQLEPFTKIRLLEESRYILKLARDLYHETSTSLLEFIDSSNCFL